MRPSSSSMGSLEGFVHGNASCGGFSLMILSNGSDIESNARRYSGSHTVLSLFVLPCFCVLFSRVSTCARVAVYISTLQLRGFITAADIVSLVASPLAEAKSAVLCVMYHSIYHLCISLWIQHLYIRPQRTRVLASFLAMSV